MGGSGAPVTSGRPPYGGRGLKYRSQLEDYDQASRPPYGGRGLKSRTFSVDKLTGESPPVWGAWIEIF